MIAGPYCPNPVTRAVVSIPHNHPLEPFLGTGYESDLRKYLNLSSSSGGQTCTLHTGYEQQMPGYGDYTDPGYTDPGYTDPGYADPGYIQPSGGSAYEATAWDLLGQAQGMLSTMDPNSAWAIALSGAIANLQGILNSGYYDESTLVSAIGLLTQVMAGIY
jgi:hypothetical protein